MGKVLSADIQPEMLRTQVITTDDLTLGMVEQVRLILRGGSVVDWYRLRFEDVEDIRAFLHVNRFDVQDPEDLQRLRSLYRMAHEYLKGELRLDVSPVLWDPKHVEDPFRIAADDSDPLQSQACILLKLVHTINHYEARELRLNLSLSEREVFSIVEREVVDTIGYMRDLGYPIVMVQGSRKSRKSTLTKLLSKRRATAADILDRVRFRVILESVSDIPCFLAGINQLLLPYNYVIPEETTNDIIDFRKFFEGLTHLQSRAHELQFDLALEELDPLRRDANECSADGFRMLNFVIDLPIRIDEVLARPENSHVKHLGKLVFLNVEFQLFDRATWDFNELNPGTSHSSYKDRQRDRVRSRLMHGFEPHNNALKLGKLSLEEN